MRSLYLIRHATPAVQPNVPAPEWPLSDRGLEEARVLAATAQTWGLSAIYASSERKAQSTAAPIGELLGIPVHVVEGFEELRIDGWIGNSNEFAETVQQILEEPDLSLRGAERAVAAAERFQRGIEIIQQGQFPAAIASHGRVLTAWLARTGRAEDPFALWRSIPMPGWALIDLDVPGKQPVFVG
jgi:broad specificity phosphatase PhoE